MTEEPQGDPPQTLLVGNVTEDPRPQQFKAIEDWLHAERERVKDLTLNWRPSLVVDRRDTRSPQLLGETLLRMQTSLGPLARRQDLLELRG